MSVRKTRQNHSLTSLVDVADNQRFSEALEKSGVREETRLQPEPTAAQMSVDSVEFSVLSKTKKELIQDATKILLRSIDSEVFKVDGEECKEAIEEFVVTVAEEYNDTPFHSFRHAVDVMQLMDYMMNKHLRHSVEFFVESNFTLLAAALCHDIGHFGMSNAELRQSKHELVTKYGKISTLENYHVEKAMKVVDSCELFSSKYLRKGMKPKITAKMRDLILWTDMDRHGEFVQEYTKTRKSQKVRVTRRFSFFRPEKEPLPSLYLAATIKLCDLANVFRNFADTREWAKLLNLECSSKTKVDDDNTIAKFSLKFMGSVVNPLIDEYATLSKGAAVELRARLQFNMNKWEEIRNSTV